MLYQAAGEYLYTNFLFVTVYPKYLHILTDAVQCWIFIS